MSILRISSAPSPSQNLTSLPENSSLPPLQINASHTTHSFLLPANARQSVRSPPQRHRCRHATWYVRARHNRTNFFFFGGERESSASRGRNSSIWRSTSFVGWKGMERGEETPLSACPFRHHEIEGVSMKRLSEPRLRSRSNCVLMGGGRV